MAISVLAALLLVVSVPPSEAPACTTGASCVELGRKFAAGDGERQSWTTARELFRHGCERGEGEGCMYEGVFTPRGLPEGNPAAALPRLRKSCDQRSAQDCTDLGKLFDLRNDPASTRAAYQRGCELGDAAGCDLLGLNLLTRRFGAVDHAGANASFAKACELGEPYGCTWLGFDTASGIGVTADSAKANELYKRACDAGGKIGCYYLAFGQGTDVAATQRLLQKSCESRHRLACVKLGQLLKPGTGHPEDDTRATAWFKIACDDGSGTGCTALGLEHAAGIGFGRDAEAAASLFQKACALGDGEGCARLGGTIEDVARARQLYALGCETYDSSLACEKLAGQAETSGDWPRAAVLLGKACDRQRGSTCARLGELELSGKPGLAADTGRGLGHLDRACRLNEGSGCARLALAYDEQDPARANELFLQACRLHDASACFRLAQNYAEGRGTPPLPQRAGILYGAACDLDIGAACVGAANNYILGPSYDPVRAWHLYQRACDLDDHIGCTSLREFTARFADQGKNSCAVDLSGNGCNTLGLAYLNGIGVDRDLDKARTAFEKSCNHGDHRGCGNFAIISTGELGGRADWAKAHAVQAGECDAGNAYSCSELAWFFESGRGVRADRARAEALYRKANAIFEEGCQANDASACEALATNEENGRGGPPNRALAKTLRAKVCTLRPCSAP